MANDVSPLAPQKPAAPDPDFMPVLCRFLRRCGSLAAGQAANSKRRITSLAGWEKVAKGRPSAMPFRPVVHATVLPHDSICALPRGFLRENRFGGKETVNFGKLGCAVMLALHHSSLGIGARVRRLVTMHMSPHFTHLSLRFSAILWCVWIKCEILTLNANELH